MQFVSQKDTWQGKENQQGLKLVCIRLCEARQQLHRAAEFRMGILEKIKDIEDEMAKTQKNKATEYHLGQLKARLAKLRTELQAPSAKGAGGEGFEVTKYGDGRVALIGFPSVGKSSLLTLLTGTESEAAAYEFTTLTCIPGIIHYNESKIQLLDLPGIIEGAAEGKGRGRQVGPGPRGAATAARATEVIAVCKSADLLLMVLDATKPWTHRDILTRELESVGMRLNKSPPNVYFRKRKTGGLSINSTIQLTQLDDKMIARILQEYRIHNCELLFKEDIGVDDLIDLIEGNRRYIKCLYVYNKVDMASIEEVDEIAHRPNSVPISCSMNLNMDGLLCAIWDAMALVGASTRPLSVAEAPASVLASVADMVAVVRCYTKKVGAKPDFGDPVVMTQDRGGTTVEALCRQVEAEARARARARANMVSERMRPSLLLQPLLSLLLAPVQVHASLVTEFKYALVWGTSSKHYPQRCGLTHKLEDEDVVQIVKKKVKTGEDGRGRFKNVGAGAKPDRIADREKKAALKS
ncbi:hypothetical protein QJQ45_018563 [Haematococcus lacustris]|nr:hypothetical protein QJQ45_018563 [Haematococcus lacustris]